MSKHEPQDHGGYESTDAHAGDTYRAGLYILGTMVLSALVVVPMYRFLARKEAREQKPAATVLTADPNAGLASVPRLVTSEPLALAEFRAQEDALLTSYGWVEKDKGIARLPIDVAMRIVAERGLPEFPAPSPSPAPAGGAR
jgi:hypothetical protein